MHTEYTTPCFTREFLDNQPKIIVENSVFLELTDSEQIRLALPQAALLLCKHFKEENQL